MLAVLENPLDQLQDLDEPSYCHAICKCMSSNITICGAYKPNRCGVLNIEMQLSTYCPVCQRLTCPDCRDLPCSVCGMG